MAGNYFDKYVQLPPPDGPSGGGNHFDQYLSKPGQEGDAPAEPGFIPTVKRTGGQMLTTAATSAEDVPGPNSLTQAVKKTGQGIIDRNPAGIRSLSDAVDSPWLTVKESLGQFAPQIAAAVAGGAPSRRRCGRSRWCSPPHRMGRS